VIEECVIRPGLRSIILAPETTPESDRGAAVINFACFSTPFNTAEVARSSGAEQDRWRDAIQVT
jgi:hypothetical protein